ncbi:MAG: ribosome maturation factor RimM [Bacteroidota bacterium]|nr:ribosome maturation factor RimM [Bacteroidota bacterium]
MDLTNFINIGVIRKTHGTQGEVQVLFNIDDPETILNKRTLFVLLEPNKVPFFIKEFSFLPPEQAYIKFEDIDTNKIAKTLVGCEILLPKEMLPKNEGALYQEITGYKVIDKAKGYIGYIKEILKYPSQDLLQVIYNEKEILIPISEEFVLDINHDEKTIYITTPDGLIDLYL